MAGQPGAKELVTHLIKGEFREEKSGRRRHRLFNTSIQWKGRDPAVFT